MELFKVFGSIALKDEGARQGLKDIDNQAASTSGRIGSFFGKAGGLMGKAVVAGAAAAGAGLVTLTGIIGKVGIGYNSMIENSEVAWTTLLGTQEKAQNMLKDIANFTKSTQFETEQVDIMAKYMHNAGLQGKALFDELTKVADISGAFNIPAAEAQELTRQMSQVRQAGLAYTEDLNVLQDRGIPIYKAISESLGITVADVKKMASQGQLTSDIYLKAFDNIAKGVEGSSEKQSKTLTGMISTLKDNLSMISGELAKGAFDKLKSGIEFVLPLLERFYDGLKEGGLKGGLKAIFPPEMYGIITSIADTISTLKGKFDEVVDSIMAKKDNFSDVFDTIKNVFDNVKNFIKGYVDYVKQLFSGDGNLGQSFVRIFNVIKAIALPILQDAVSFIKGKFAEIKKFWDENGAQIIQAVKNMWAVIAAIFEFIAPVLGFLVESIWGNIKGIIGGALDIIMGLVKIFTGIFTGDFGKMWEGIKQLFGGALEFLWNLFSLLMIGKLLGGIKAFIMNAGNWFKAFGTAVKGTFKNFIDDVLTLFNYFKQTGSSVWRAIVDTIKNVVKIFVNSVKSNFKTILDNAVNTFLKVKDAILHPIKTARDMVKGFVDEIKGFFSSMKLKLPKIKMPHFKIKNWSMNPKDWLKTMPSLGIDWYATGTNFAPGGMAMVGERGPELIHLPRGSKVDTANETKQKMQSDEPKQPIVLQMFMNSKMIAEETYEDISILQNKANKITARKGGVVFGTT